MNRARPRRFDGARVCDPQHPSKAWNLLPCCRRADSRRLLRVTDPRSVGWGCAGLRRVAPYRGIGFRMPARRPSTPCARGGYAECNSAIQQIANLRYNKVCVRSQFSGRARMRPTKPHLYFFNRPQALRVARRRTAFSLPMGASGRRTSSSIWPNIASAALTGTGLVSRNRSLNNG